MDVALETHEMWIKKVKICFSCCFTLLFYESCKSMIRLEDTLKCLHCPDIFAGTTDLMCLPEVIVISHLIIGYEKEKTLP